MESGGRHIPNMIDNIHLGPRRRLASDCVVSNSKVWSSKLAWELTRHQIWRPTNRLPSAPCCLHGHASCSVFSHSTVPWFQPENDPRHSMQYLLKLFYFLRTFRGVCNGCLVTQRCVWLLELLEAQCVDRFLFHRCLDLPGDTEGLV